MQVRETIVSEYVCEGCHEKYATPENIYKCDLCGSDACYKCYKYLEHLVSRIYGIGSEELKAVLGGFPSDKGRYLVLCHSCTDFIVDEIKNLEKERMSFLRNLGESLNEHIRDTVLTEVKKRPLPSIPPINIVLQQIEKTET